MWNQNSYFNRGIQKVETVQPVKQEPKIDPKIVKSWRDEINSITFDLGESDARLFEECMMRLEALEESMDDVLRSAYANHSSNRNPRVGQVSMDFEDLSNLQGYPV